MSGKHIDTRYQRYSSHPRRKAVQAVIDAIRAELHARNNFKDNQTTENLTAWANARNTLEDRKQAL